MLHMHYEVEVVQQYPALLPVALTAYRLGIVSSQRLLDPVDDRADLALVGGGDHQEHIGNGQLLRDVVGDQIGAKLVDSRCRSSAGQFQRALGSSQDLSICRTILLTSSEQRAPKASRTRPGGVRIGAGRIGSAGGSTQPVQQRPRCLIKEGRLSLVADLHNRNISEAGFPVRLHSLHNRIKIRTAGDLRGHVLRSDERARPLEAGRCRTVRVHRKATAEPAELIMGSLDRALLLGIPADWYL